MSHRFRAPVAVVAFLAVAFTPVTGVALADPPAAPAVSVDRSLALQAVQNARDIGGYRTTDGRTVRTGLVYRTGQLSNATAPDLALLTDRRVRSVYDLRTAYERALGPDRVPAGATATWVDVIGQAPPDVLATTLTGGPGLYRAFITARGANEAFASVLRAVIETDGAVLFHCTAGKDRTGWAAAILLTLLGVDRATVTEDYLLSNRYRNASGDDPLNGVQQSWLDAAFDQVDQTYGSFGGYVQEGLKLTDVEIAALRAALLA
ncbi:tyrosine-protein phosphatase [Nocardia sp. R6R-6]|uniref:tyrosine-protein phosphatase n=1 Tax=Nocardia sp. R6R-6 TaxID=3459303 RepID=UPI00403D9316